MSDGDVVTDILATCVPLCEPVRVFVRLGDRECESEGVDVPVRLIDCVGLTLPLGVDVALEDCVSDGVAMTVRLVVCVPL